MKVFLVVPRGSSPKQTYREYPLGAGLIATALRQRGHCVTVFDQNAEDPADDLLSARLSAFAPQVVGFSIITPAYPTAQRQIQQVRSHFPDALIVAGGIHASLFPEDILADGADVVVLGEGCATMTALVESRRDTTHWRDLPGIAFRDAAGRTVRSGWAKCPAGSVLEIVDRDVYDLSLYTHHSMLASLGCPYRCTFCANYSGTLLEDGVVIRSHQRIIEEMRMLRDRYAAKQIFFVDDVFLLGGDNVRAFCGRLEQERLGMQWIAQMRADAVSPEVARSMVAAGCQRVYFGVEAGSEAILRRIRKGIDRETVRLAVHAVKEAGMRVKTGWVFGLPGSVNEQYESVDFMRELRPHEISIHQLIPFPGTEYYARPEAHGVRIRDPKDFASFCYGGLGDNVSFDYLSRTELIELMEYTVAALESDGYVGSDVATPSDKYIFSTPLNARSMCVFQPEE